jgi:hypothetical protein
LLLRDARGRLIGGSLEGIIAEVIKVRGGLHARKGDVIDVLSSFRTQRRR